MHQQPEMMAVASRQIQIAGAASTLIGGRAENQDNLAWTDTPLGFLIVVCDGMGGGPGGSIASSLATTTFIRTVAEAGADADRATTMRMAVARAEDALEAHMRADHSLQGMGSTLVAMLISQQSAMIVHLGDSRCYRMHAGKMLFRTTDHSLVAELVHNKALTEEQARTSPQSNVITRGLGSTTNHVAEIDVLPYRAGDRFVLCTDGIWGSMPHEQLLQHLGAQLPPATIVANLQQEVDRIGASAGGKHDNHTLVILETGTDSTLKDKMSKQIKIIIATLTACLLVSIIVNAALAIAFRSKPGQEELEKAWTQMAQYAQSSSTLEQLNEQQVKDFALSQAQMEQKVYILHEDNQMLYETIDEYDRLNDSLAKELTRAQVKIATLERKTTPPAAAKTTPTTKPARSSYKIGTMEPKELAQMIIAELNNMKKCRAKDGWMTAAKKQKESRQNLNTWLRQLNKATNKDYDRDLGDIIINLRDENVLNIDNTKDKDGYYHPTKYALNIIEQMINKFEAIQKKINKQ